MFKKTIPLEEAKAQVRHWRSYYADAYNFYEKHQHNEDETIPKDVASRTPIDANHLSVFRGFFVKLEDLMGIKDILEGYLALNPGASSDQDKIGIRVYLAKHDRYKSDQDNMHVVIVPVVDNKDIVEFSLTANPNTKTGEEGTNSQSISTSTIFDFSAPCPNTCDRQSPLF